jgi:Asp/Glu/hydantoin racemase
MKTFFKQLLAVCVVLSMVGCTTLQPLAANSSSLASSLKPGDRVELVTTRGERIQLKIDSVDANGLQGSGKQVAFNDIQSISRKETDSMRTAWVVIGVVAAGALAAAAGGGGGGGNGY